MARVLIIDDSRTQRAFMRQALEHDGHEVVELDLFVGLPALLRDHIPDVVLLDLKMPGLDGIDMGDYIRRFETRPTAIVIYSSAPDAEREEAVRRLGARAHLAKTSDPDRLRACIASALG